MRLNIAQLVADLGGAAQTARLIGTQRTAPYRWIAASYVSSRVLEQIKAAVPHIDIDDYFEADNDNKTGRGA